jgi:undecaprenyl-diphosphatase
VALFEMIQAADEAILRSARGSPGWAVPAAYVITMVGGGWGLLVLVPFILRRTSRPGALWLLGCVLTASLLVPILKHVASRMRPCVALSWSSALSVTCPSDFSFPSGHAAGSFAFSTFVALRIPKLGVPALIFSTLVAWSRPMLGVHYPSDIFVGAALGASVGALFAHASRVWAERRIAAG